MIELGKQTPPIYAERAFKPQLPEKSQPDVELSAEERKVARQQWREGKCTWCGGLHLRACPRVKRLVFANDGKTVTEVEYWPDGRWETDNIVWPEDLKFEEEEDS